MVQSIPTYLGEAGFKLYKELGKHSFITFERSKITMNSQAGLSVYLDLDEKISLCVVEDGELVKEYRFTLKDMIEKTA